MWAFFFSDQDLVQFERVTERPWSGSALFACSARWISVSVSALLWVLRVCALPYQALGTALNLLWTGQFPALCHYMSFYSKVRRG